MHTTSVTLLERLREPGEQNAWARFVKLYSPLLIYWARRKGMQDTDAADLVQDVFCVLVQKLPEFQYDGSRSFRNWLRTDFFNKWRDRQRQRAAQPAQDHDVALADVADTEHGDGLEAVEYQRLLLDRGLELLAGDFQSSTWNAFWEHGYKGRPAAEVAAELGLTVGAVWAAKFRVVARLREDLQGLME